MPNYCPFNNGDCRFQKCMVFDEEKKACSFLLIARRLGRL